jgi:SAM-dependent methyltransferase
LDGAGGIGDEMSVMQELSKSIFGRLRDNRYVTRYFVGDGVDIGAGPDPLWHYREMFPLMKSCRSWDVPDGDAQHLHGIEDNSLDFVHSCHCLEHMVDPWDALYNWWRVLKPGGHLICIVPDEDMYEQGIFPSTWQPDHKRTFTIQKNESWCEQSVNVFDLVKDLGDSARVCKIELLDATHRDIGLLDPSLIGRRGDQTMTAVGECAIEFVLRKL